MLDISLWTLAMSVMECGMVFLTVWLWKMINKTSSGNMEDLCIVGFIFAFILACILGLMLATSAVLGMVRMFRMYA